MNIDRIMILSILIFLISCQSPNKVSLDNDLCNKYFYLTKDENGKINSEGKVLLHLSENDSVFIEPEKICSLHFYPNWERKEFPFEVLGFINLQYLWIGMRDFRVLPYELSQLKQMQYLDIQHSGVRALSKNIGELKDLEQLILLGSDIQSLPKSICELKNLRRLHLGSTEIKKLPDCLRKLENLEEFILFYTDGNDFSKELHSDIEELKIQLENCKFAVSNYLVD